MVLSTPIWHYFFYLFQSFVCVYIGLQVLLFNICNFIYEIFLYNLNNLDRAVELIVIMVRKWLNCSIWTIDETLKKYLTLTCYEPAVYSWQIHPAVDRINTVTTEKIEMHWCKIWPMEDKHCVRVNHGQWKTTTRECKLRSKENKHSMCINHNYWKTSIACVNRRGPVGHVGVLRLRKV